MSDTKTLKVGPWENFRKGFEKRTHPERYLFPTISIDRGGGCFSGDHHDKGKYENKDTFSRRIALHFWRWTLTFWMAWERTVLYQTIRTVQVDWDWSLEQAELMDWGNEERGSERCLKLQEAFREAGVEFRKIHVFHNEDRPLKVTLLAGYCDGHRQEVKVGAVRKGLEDGRLYDWLHEHDEPRPPRRQKLKMFSCGWEAEPSKENGSLVSNGGCDNGRWIEHDSPTVGAFVDHGWCPECNSCS